MLQYKGSKIQVLDLPGIIEGAAHGAGRGKEVIAVARSADVVLVILDAAKEGLQKHREILERELETVGIRLNERPPDVTLTKRKSGGGVKFASTVPQPLLGPEPEKLVTQILREYRISSADVLAREEITVDQLVDVVAGNREYKPWYVKTCDWLRQPPKVPDAQSFFAMALTPVLLQSISVQQD